MSDFVRVKWKTKTKKVGKINKIEIILYMIIIYYHSIYPVYIFKKNLVLYLLQKVDTWEKV